MEQNLEQLLADLLQIPVAQVNDELAMMDVEAFAFDSHFLVYRYGTQRQRALRRYP